MPDQPQDPQTVQAPPITVQVEGIGSVQFPAGTSQDDMKKALDAYVAKQHVDKGEAVPHPVVARLLDWLPAAGGTIGGILGAAAGLPEGGVGAIPGGAIGAAAGGSGGEILRQNINRAVGNPSPTSASESVGKIVGQGALQAGADVLGAGIPAVAGKLAPAIMTKAAKPAAALLDEFRTKAPQLAKTLLDEGVNVTRGGVAKLSSLLDSTREELRTMLANSTAAVPKSNVLAEVLPTADKLANQPNPIPDLEAVGKQVEGFVNHPKFTNKTMTPRELQELKTGTYDKLAGSYGERGSAVVETDKAIARGAKNEIEAAVPQAKSLNQRQADLMAAREAVAKQVGLAANRDAGGLTWIASHPTNAIGWMLEKSPAVKSLLARGLYTAAAAAAGVPPSVLKLAVHSLVSAPVAGVSEMERDQ